MPFRYIIGDVVAVKEITMNDFQFPGEARFLTALLKGLKGVVVDLLSEQHNYLLFDESTMEASYYIQFDYLENLQRIQSEQPELLTDDLYDLYVHHQHELTILLVPESAVY